MGKITTKYNNILRTAALLALASSANAGLLDDVTKETNNSKEYFAIWDIPNVTNPDALYDQLKDSIRVQATSAHATRPIQAAEPPEFPSKMEFKGITVMGITIPMPSCNGHNFQITTMDNSMAQFGDSTMMMACVFPYQTGMRINYYARFSEQVGTSSLISGAFLGKMLTKAIGLGDSSKFVASTMDQIDADLKKMGLQATLIQLQPAMEGKIVSADPIAAQLQKNKQSASNTQATLAARKELTGIGLTYSSRDQFVDAIKRGDVITVDLFVKARGVDLKSADASGKTLSRYATDEEVIAILKGAGAS
ncbi:hypothetical protein K4H28_01930 [Deefgea tanakiae]|uniref:Uncharacterized protein n=1 Tax=Deefgea tanakiae TaxID=2865840 RepID=A0ABX8Z739_9NEIS|nr:hypothetical protein [Deefgea tanakiae]QZA78205.1 hypothetical protein K4H28_01930 [Deefgea tanakiae]